MELKSAALLVADILSGDAQSQHTFDLARLLIKQGATVSIHSNGRIGSLPSDIQAITAQTHPSDYNASAQLTILQYPIWFPLAERFRDSKGVSVFWYHGVTPPALWGTVTEREVLERAEAGTELVWYAHLAVADSPFIAQELHRHSGYPQERIRVVPLGVDTAGFRQVPAKEELDSLRRRWQIEGRRILLYTGRVAGNKCLELPIEAMVRLRELYPDVHLLIVGDTEATTAYRETAARLRSLVGRLGLAHDVTFTGRVGSIEPYYHLAEAYLLPSQHEGFGLPLVEAMAAGVPIVASASGAIPWVLDAEVTGTQAAGLLFPAGDVDALVEKVSQVLGQPGLREGLIERGRQRVEHFSQDKFSLRAAEVLREAQQLALQGPAPAASQPRSWLYDQADISLRGYRVRSRVPALGRLIEWIRHNSTTHLKEAYLDRIIERQVVYNRLLADEVSRLRAEVARLKASMDGNSSANGHEGSSEVEPERDPGY
jgi:glycosyltransferase involved in cell wall biosynthesis